MYVFCDKPERDLGQSLASSVFLHLLVGKPSFPASSLPSSSQFPLSYVTCWLHRSPYTRVPTLMVLIIQVPGWSSSFLLHCIHKDCLHRYRVEIVHSFYLQQFYNRPENKTADAVTLNIYLHNPQLASLSELQFCFLFNWPFGETLWEKK